jgi:hypothetical protein
MESDCIARNCSDVEPTRGVSSGGNTQWTVDEIGEMGTSASLEIRAQRWVQHVVVSRRGQGVPGVPLPLSLHVLNATTNTKHRDERAMRAHTRSHQHFTLPMHAYL